MKRVLIVDDELGIVDALTDVLADEGFTVSSARNGREALKRIADTKPDLIISDYMMPLIDGLELIGLLRQAGSTVPIVLMTAVRLDHLPAGLNVAAVMQKPFSIDQLVAVVKKALP